MEHSLPLWSMTSRDERSVGFTNQQQQLRIVVCSPRIIRVQFSTALIDAADNPLAMLALGMRVADETAAAAGATAVDVEMNVRLAVAVRTTRCGRASLVASRNSASVASGERRASVAKISWMLPQSHLEPSEMKISSASIAQPRAA